MTMTEVTGLSSDAKDQTAVGGGQSGTASAGPTATPAQDHEFVYAAVCHQISFNPVVTWGNDLAYGQGKADHNDEAQAERAVADGWKVITTAAAQTASCTFGSPRVWSIAVVTFRPEGPPAAPVATAATSVTARGFTANWSAASRATSYRLDVATDSAFTSYVMGYQDLTVSDTSQTVGGLAPATAYYYRVRAANTEGASSNSNTITTTSAPRSRTIHYTPKGTYSVNSGPSNQGVTLAETPAITIAPGAWLIVSVGVEGPWCPSGVVWGAQEFGGTPLTLLASSEYGCALRVCVYGLYCASEKTGTIRMGWGDQGELAPTVVCMTMTQVLGLTPDARDAIAVGSGS